MRRTILAAAGLALTALAALAALSGVGASAPGGGSPSEVVGPLMPEDTGDAERLLLVVGGVFDTRSEAQAAAEAMTFGDVQGYYAVPAARFDGLRQQLQRPGDWALVSAFRTAEGAQEFAELSSALGYPTFIVPSRVRSLGGVYAGLGQESRPDGTGPLTEPIPESMP